MRTLRHLAAPAAAGLLLLLVAGPATAGNAGVQPDPAGLAVRQSILTELSATGAAGTSRVVTQVSSDEAGAVTLPAQSTADLRGLSGFSRPSVDGDAVTWAFDGPGLRRTVATNDAGVPVEFDITYTLDGEAISPEDLLGRTGELTVTYAVRNTSGVPTEVSYVDGRGNPRTRTVDVPIPLVGSMSTVLDERFAAVAAPGAAVVGDGRGNTVVNWSLVLFPPLGAEEVVRSYTAQVSDAVVPAASAQILPVTSRSFGSMASASEAYGDAAASTTELTEGSYEIHSNLRTLAQGAGQLLSGLNALAAGATKLSDGLGDAASGSGELATGTGAAAEGGTALASGLRKLDAGAGRLAEGLGAANAGGQELGAGLGRLADGAGELSAGLSRARGGSSELAAGLAALDAGAAELSTGAGALAAGAAQLDAKTGELVAGTEELSGGADQLVGGLQTLKTGLNAADGLPAAQGGIARISGGVGKVIDGIGATSTAGTLLNGLFRISAGMSNPACSLANPQDPTNPCGVRQVLHLLQLGADNPAAFDATNPGYNPTCADPTKQPCGADQGLQLLEGGLGRVEAGAAGLESGTAAVAGGLGTTFRDGLQGIQTNATTLATASAGVATQLEVVNGERAALSAGAQTALDTAMATNGTIGTGLTGIAGGAGALIAGLGDPQTDGVAPETCSAANTAYATLVAARSPVPVLLALKVIECGAEAIDAGIGAAGTAGTLLDGTAKLRAGVARSAAGLATLRSKIGDTATMDTLVNGVARVMGGLDNPTARTLNPACTATTDPTRVCGAKQGLQAVQDGLGQLSGGLSDALAKINAGLGSVTVPGETLLYGAGSLAAGAELLADGAGRLRREGTTPLAAGAGQLADGAGQLATGAAAAAAGGQELAGGLVQLDEGGKALAAGASKAVDGTSALVNGLGRLDAGGEELAAGAAEAAAGAGELSTGLGQLDDGAGRLAAGLGDAADGSGVLAENLGKAAAGGDRIADGSQRLLYEGTKVMTESVNDAAADTALTVATLLAADERGSTEGLPYGVPEGASASAVYAFEIAAVEGSKGLSQPGRAATAAGLFGVTSALGVLGRRRFGLV